MLRFACVVELKSPRDVAGKAGVEAIQMAFALEDVNDGGVVGHAASNCNPQAVRSKANLADKIERVPNGIEIFATFFPFAHCYSCDSSMCDPPKPASREVASGRRWTKANVSITSRPRNCGPPSLARGILRS